MLELCVSEKFNTAKMQITLTTFKKLQAQLQCCWFESLDWTKKPYIAQTTITKRS